jgi:hypothetical protein
MATAPGSLQPRNRAPMLRGAAVVAMAAAAFFLIPGSGRTQALAPVSDDRVYSSAGGRLMLQNAAEEGVLEDTGVAGEFARLGVVQACRLYNAALTRVLESREPGFRPLFVAAIRRQVPPEVLGGSEGPVAWGTAPLLSRKARIARDIEESAGGLLRDAHAAFLAAVLADAGAGQPSGEGNGVFADWDLSRRGAFRAACMLLRVSRAGDLARKKLPFDQFFLRTGSR